MLLTTRQRLSHMTDTDLNVCIGNYELRSKKTWKRWVSAGMEPAGSPVIIVRDGYCSSPDAPRGTGGDPANKITLSRNFEYNMMLLVREVSCQHLRFTSTIAAWS